MEELLDYLRLRAKARTGVNRWIMFTYALAVWIFTATLLWGSVSLFLWLSNDWFTQLQASLILTVGYLILCIVGVVGALIASHFAAKRAEAKLAAQKASMFDPSMITMGLEIGRAIGWRRLISLAGVVLLTSGLAKEWIGRNSGPRADDEN